LKRQRTTVFQFEINGIAFANLVSQTGYVYEILLTVFVVDDETIAFAVVEEFNRTCFH